MTIVYAEVFIADTLNMTQFQLCSKYPYQYIYLSQNIIAQTC